MLTTVTPGNIPPLSKEHEIETRTATEAIRKFVAVNRVNDKKEGKCFFCPTIGLQESHVIKGETLRLIANKKKLLTPFDRKNSMFSILAEDQQEISASKAFTFILICNPCDDKFSYERKSSSKDLYDAKDLESIALKIRLKELYDNFERMQILKYRPTNELESLIQSTFGNKLQMHSSINDEKTEIKQIRAGLRNYKAFADGFLHYRIPFAMESFIAPEMFPKTKKMIVNNSYTAMNVLNNFGIDHPMSSFYVLMQPNSKSNDNWSRLTVFFDENDEIMIRWFDEFSKINRTNTEKLANAMISYHLNVSGKNFVMSHNINKNFLSKVRRTRIEPISQDPMIQSNWMKILREKKK